MFPVQHILGKPAAVMLENVGYRMMENFMATLLGNYKLNTLLSTVHDNGGNEFHNSDGWPVVVK